MIKAAREETEVFVEDAEHDDDEKGEDERSCGCDVPALEDDTGVDDVGVPADVGLD